jgi:hypothetical protein
MYNEMYFGISIIALLKSNMFIDSLCQPSPSNSPFSFFHSCSPYSFFDSFIPARQSQRLITYNLEIINSCFIGLGTRLLSKSY